MKVGVLPTLVTKITPQYQNCSKLSIHHDPVSVVDHQQCVHLFYIVAITNQSLMRVFGLGPPLTMGLPRSVKSITDPILC